MNRWTLAALIVPAAAAALPAADPVDYARDVKPILRDRCVGCHGGLKQQGKLRLDTAALAAKGGKSGPAVVPGATTSLLIDRITDPDAATRMPPEGKPLTAEQIAALTAWVAQGAKAPADEQPEPRPADHWAFRPVRRPAVPPAGKGPNPIDAFLAAEWATRGLTPAAPADPAILLRRVHLDLTGLPPPPEQVRAFLADPSLVAYERVVEALLASPAYGERWGRRWMDVWRYSDWYGRRSVPDNLNSYGQIWRWRDWIVRSLNDDRGYDEMVRLMLAADELAPGNDADAVATGFLVRNFFRWNYNNWMRDNVEHSAKAFLGLTANCCHCHDHKYDPLTQEEYFQLRAVFEPIDVRHDRWPGEPDPGPYPKYEYTKSYKPIASGLVRVMDADPEAVTRFYTGGDERNVMKDRPPIPPGVPAALGGTFRVEPVSLPVESWFPGSRAVVRKEETTRREDAVAAARSELDGAKNPAAVRLAGAKLAAATWDLIAVKARIAADDVVVLGAKGDPKAAAEAASKAERQHAAHAAELALLHAELAVSGAKTGTDAAKTAAAEKQFADAAAKLAAARKAVETASIAYTPLSPVYPKTSSGRRAALAKWITSPENPLAARVAVNHIWAGHFGRPLAEPVENLGRSGKPPTHPLLLDWLASELMRPQAAGARAWGMKHVHRLIVTSRTYRLSSNPTDAAVKSDPDNAYLSRFPTNRLEAEAVRDGLLAAAGELDAATGGPELPQDEGTTSRRRSLYFSHHGEARMPFLALFDAANPCDAYRRTASVLPQQALALANSDLAVRLSRVLAGKLAGGADDGAFVRAAFERVLSRPPRDNEQAASLKFLAAQRTRLTAANDDPGTRARADLILALFNHTDFVTVR